MNWKTRKIKASAMQFAIFVSAVVAILLSTFLLLVHTHRSFSARSNQVISNIGISNKGISYMFDPKLEISDSLNIVIDKIPVSLEKSFWGGFEKISAKGGKGSKAFKKIALLGSDAKEPPANIYLEDHKLPLVVAGNTRLEGEAYLPEDMVKPGNISGNYYYGTSLIYGNRYRSRSKLPDLDPEWINYVKKMLNFVPTPNDIIVAPEGLKNSFFSESLISYNNEKIYLDQEIIGNIIVKSETATEISRYAKLDQVLLIAPKVVFDAYFKGNVHVIAEEVIVKDHVSLSYPSSLTVFNQNNKFEMHPERLQPFIRIGENTSFQGNILYLNSSEDKNSKRDIVIGKNSLVEGQIYCQGYTELKGTVVGSLFTQYFVANEAGSIYINHIYNGAVLTPNDKHKTYGILFNGKSKNVASWLY